MLLNGHAGRFNVRLTSSLVEPLYVRIGKFWVFSLMGFINIVCNVRIDNCIFTTTSISRVYSGKVLLGLKWGFLVLILVSTLCGFEPILGSACLPVRKLGSGQTWAEAGFGFTTPAF